MNTDERELSAFIELWKKTVDVQQHFNDIELRIRNIAITLLAAVLGAAAVALRERQFLLSTGILAAGLIAWVAFFLMDFFWYHRLLRGAVDYGTKLETVINERLPELKDAQGLTQAIGKASPSTLPNYRWLGKYRGRTVHSSGKMRLFYFLFALPLIAGMIASTYLHYRY